MLLSMASSSKRRDRKGTTPEGWGNKRKRKRRNVRRRKSKIVNLQLV